MDSVGWRDLCKEAVAAVAVAIMALTKTTKSHSDLVQRSATTTGAAEAAAVTKREFVWE